MQLFGREQPDELARVVARVGLLPLAVEAGRELIRARKADRAQEMLQAVAALPEVQRQRFEQFRVARLRLPALRERARVQARQVELVEGLDDADAHELRPEQVHGRARELGVRGENARQLCPRLGARPRALAREDERGIVRAAGARNPDHARPFGIVARVVVVDQELARLRLAVLPVHQVARPAEERGVAEELAAGLAAQPEVDLLEVPGAVVAGDARQVDAQERLRVEDGQLVVGVELLHHPEVAAVVGLRLALHVLAGDHVRRRHDGVALGGCGDDRARDVVVGAVNPQVFLHPVVEQVLAAAHLAVGAERVHEEVGPLVDVGLALEQAVDEPFPLGRVAVGREGADLFGRRDAAREIQAHAAEELLVGGERRVGHHVARHPAEDVEVDEISGREADAVRGGSLAEGARHAVGDRAGFRLGNLEQWRVGLGELARAHRLLARLLARVVAGK